MTDKLNNEELAVEGLMSTENGREFIWNQLQSCAVFDSTFDSDPIASAYNSGMRDAGLRLDRLVRETCPELYLKMKKENM